MQFNNNLLCMLKVRVALGFILGYIFIYPYLYPRETEHGKKAMPAFLQIQSEWNNIFKNDHLSALTKNIQMGVILPYFFERR